MNDEQEPTLSVTAAVRRIRLDRAMLTGRVEEQTPEQLALPYQVAGGPIGDFCESLRDLVAHVLMWDEVSLAVLTEARAGRMHWSLDPAWESAAAGSMLNRAGVLSGRLVPVDLLLHRFAIVRDSLLDELSRYEDEQWRARTALGHPRVSSVGALAEYVMTVPGSAAYWHAAIHLGLLAEVSTENRAVGQEA